MDSSADWLAAGAAAFEALVVTVAVVVAYFQYRDARRAGEQAAQDAATTLEATTRPYVLVDFDLQRVQGTPHLVIVNTGQTAATDVHFRFHPPLSSGLDDEHGALNIGFLRDGLPTLAPGREIASVFDDLGLRGERPNRYEATVTYRGPLGEYVDRHVLDLDAHLGTTYIVRHGVHDVHMQLKVIADTVRDTPCRPILP